MIEHGIRRDVATGQIDTGEVVYASLLVILRNNDLAAATIDDIVSIVPVNIIRQFPLPVLNEDDESIADDEWITRVIQLKNAPAASLVPIMRPMLPQAGHLAAHPMSNTILIVDRSSNVNRNTWMILKLQSKNAAAEQIVYKVAAGP